MEYLSHNYKTSKDYKKLFELIKTEIIVCFVNSYKNPDGTYMKDVCISNRKYDPEFISISARGISYIDAFEFDGLSIEDDFIQQCERIELEYIIP